jgi:hypothetical protein
MSADTLYWLAVGALVVIVFIALTEDLSGFDSWY